MSAGEHPETDDRPLLGRLRIVLDRHGVWIDELILLLDQVIAHGSINRAGQQTGMGYRRAWQVLHDAADILGIPLLESKAGGAAGGGSVATAAAGRLRERLERIQQDLERELSRLLAEARAETAAGSDSPDAGAGPSAGYASAAQAPGLPSPADLLIASSVEPVESGLLPALEEAVARDTGIRLRHVATGSGEALAMALSGRADLALSHAPRLEQSLLDRGKLRQRQALMASRFVLACGSADPLGLSGSEGAFTLAGLFAALAEAGALFVTRADGSGTHLREQEIWEALDIDPQGAPWYLRSEESGALGAVETARRRGGYTLVDALISRSRNIACATPTEDSLSRNVYALVVPARGDHHAADRDPPTGPTPYSREALDRLLEWLRGSAMAGLAREFQVEDLAAT